MHQMVLCYLFFFCFGLEIVLDFCWLLIIFSNAAFSDKKQEKKLLESHTLWTHVGPDRGPESFI